MAGFDDKIAIVTGGASGLGRALSEALAQEGAVVVVADLDGEAAARLAAALVAAGGRAQAARTDVADAADVQALIEATAGEHGRLDLMVNNAGVGFSGDMRDATLEHWRRIVDVNVLGVVHGTMAAYGVMAAQGFGHIVNVASLAGLLGEPMSTPYAASKFAVVGLSASLRHEAADLGVRVSVVCPGYIRTGIYDTRPVLGADRQEALAQIPFRMMDPGRAAAAVLRGVARNRATIVFPLYGRWLWRLYRLHPGLLAPVGRNIVRNFRRLAKP